MRFMRTLFQIVAVEGQKNKKTEHKHMAEDVHFLLRRPKEELFSYFTFSFIALFLFDLQAGKRWVAFEAQ